MTARELEGLIDVAAHQMRGPLHGMSLLFHLVERASLGSEKIEAGTFLRGRRFLSRLDRTLEELLELSQLWGGRLNMQMQEFDLIELLRDMGRKVDAARAGDLHLDLPAHPVPLRADRSRLAHVIYHLLDNAAQYTPPGSPIRVSVHLDERMVEVQVADQGPGIEPRRLPWLLRQHEWHLEHAPHGNGLGVGLFLAQELVQRHGGTFCLSPGTGGEGLLCRVRLPRLPA